MTAARVAGARSGEGSAAAVASAARNTARIILDAQCFDFRVNARVSGAVCSRCTTAKSSMACCRDRVAKINNRILPPHPPVRGLQTGCRLWDGPRGMSGHMRLAVSAASAALALFLELFLRSAGPGRPPLHSAHNQHLHAFRTTHSWCHPNGS